MMQPKMRLTKKIIFLLLPVLLFGACSTPQKEPVWMGKTWQEGTHFFFSGISGECDSLQEAKEQAYINAMVKAAEYVGVSVSAKTTHTLSNDYSSLESRAGLSAQDVFLAQAAIKEFKYNKTKEGSFTGYILIEYNRNLLEEEKKRRADLEKERLARIENRKKLGILTVKISDSSLSSLSGEIKHFLLNEGYLLGEGGTPLVFSMADESIDISKQNIYVCKVKIDINFKDDVRSYSATGYGNSKSQSIDDSRKRWVAGFKENFQLN